MSENTRYTVADVFLQTLEENGIDYIFSVLGSDHPSILEAYLRRQHSGKQTPRLLHFQHEFPALSAADAYARLTHKSQCVLVHVDVGTSALGQALHNASSGRAPVLVFAGLAPSTFHGELKGSRSEHVQWYQDIPNQGKLVEPYVRYSNEVKVGENVRLVVNRALMMAGTGSPGPVYLTATREVLASPATEQAMRQDSKLPNCRLGGIPDDAVKEISEALLGASKPLVVTGYLGRNHAAVDQLIQLANLIKSLRVFDSEMREMSFPADHPAWITRSTGAGKAIKEADVILVLDCDVPWIPTKVLPSSNARIFHIDLDPRKEKMQLFDIFAEESFLASTEIALQQLNECITPHPSLPEFSRQAFEIATAHGRSIGHLMTVAQPLSSGKVTCAQLFSTLRLLLPRTTTYIHDAVTNTNTLHEQLQCSLTGTSISKGGSGLGWAPAASIGVKLALDKYHISSRPKISPRKAGEGAGLVCCITGDGAFTFGCPTATYFAQHRLKTPFLTIVLNNGGWKATRSCINDVHPGGVAAEITDADIGIDLSQDGPNYVGVATAASNGTLWGRKVSKDVHLAEAIREAVHVVQVEKRGALIEVVVARECE